MRSVLAEARALVSLSEAEVRERLGSSAEEDPESDYEALEDVLELRNDAVFPGSVYLRDGRVELVYLPRAAVGGLTRDELEGEFESEAVRLRSRAGKKASMYVRPKEGIAYSADQHRVHFIEVFPPCDLEEYKRRIYVEPPKFIR